ncbi:MAG: type II CAAX endopeptidase family protein [Thermoguttaceae bacterium]
MVDSRQVQSRRADTGAVLFALVLPTLVTLAYFVLMAGYSSQAQQTTYSIGKGIQFLFPIVWVLAFQRCRPRWKGPKLGELLEGLAFGALVLVATLLLYHGWLKPHGYFDEPGAEIQKKVMGFGADTLAKYVLLGTFYALCHSFLEEYYWRWFVFGQLRRLVSFPTALVVASLGFMAHHVLVLATFFGWDNPATWLFSAAVAVGGVVWGWMVERHGSLWGPWISHLLVDAAIFAIGYDLVRHLLG